MTVAVMTWSAQSRENDANYVTSLAERFDSGKDAAKLHSVSVVYCKPCTVILPNTLEFAVRDLPCVNQYKNIVQPFDLMDFCEWHRDRSRYPA